MAREELIDALLNTCVLSREQAEIALEVILAKLSEDPELVDAALAPYSSLTNLTFSNAQARAEKGGDL